MSNFLSQLPALFGVVVGALGAFVATGFTDRTRWRREQAVRWDQRRLEALSSLASHVKEVLTTSYRLATPMRPSSRAPQLDREEGLRLLAQANGQVTVAWESVLLLADGPTVDAARRWREMVSHIEQMARGDVDDQDAWTAAVEATNLARDDFYAAARSSLGVTGGSVAQASVLRARRATLNV